MLDPIEEKRIKEVKERALKYGIIIAPDVFIRTEVDDGVAITSDINRGHSWTRNFYNFMFGGVNRNGGDGSSSFGAGYMSSRRDTGTIYSTTGGINVHVEHHGWLAIQVGTDNTAYDVEQYNLQSAVADGNGAGQLYHNTTAWESSTYDSGTDVWTTEISRVFNNNSGGTLTIWETGLFRTFASYGYGLFYSGSVAGIAFMLERSVLGSGVDVADGAQLTVTYTFEMDFSAIDS